MFPILQALLYQRICSLMNVNVLNFHKIQRGYAKFIIESAPFYLFNNLTLCD